MMKRVGSHHVVVLVVQDMAVPHIAGADGGVEGEGATGGGHKMHSVASDISWPNDRCVLQPSLIDCRWHGWPREACPWLPVRYCYIAKQDTGSWCNSAQNSRPVTTLVSVHVLGIYSCFSRTSMHIINS